MGLKAFHLVFIVASEALSLFFGTWCLREYGDSGDIAFLAMGIFGLASAVGLAFYLSWVLRKLRNVGFLAILLLSETAWACPVCLGDPNSPMSISANIGVSFLLGVIVSVLVLFAALFLHWRKRDKLWLGQAAG